MHCLNLQLQRTDGTPLFNRECGLELLNTFGQSFRTLLVQQGVVDPGEKCAVRIIPRSDNAPSFGQPVVLATPPASGDLKAVQNTVETDILSGGRVNYFTLELHAMKVETLYRFDIHLETLFGGVMKQAVQSLLDEGALADGERVRLVVSFSEKESRPAHERPKVKLKNGKRKSNPEILTSRPAATAKADNIEIVIDSVEQLVKPQPKSMKSYTDAEALGKIANDDIPIFIHRTAMKIAEQSAGSSSRSNEEVGGFLLGSVFRDPDEDRLFVEISEAVETDRARGTYVSLEFNYEAWRQVLDRIENNVCDKALVGWYHTHLVSLGSIEPVDGAPQEYIARYTTFFSQHDIFIHRHFFPSAWHVGLVMDLRCRKEVFFAWKSGQIVGAQGFYVYGQ